MRNRRKVTPTLVLWVLYNQYFIGSVTIFPSTAISLPPVLTITRRGYLADNFSIHKVRLSWSFWGKFLDRNIHILSIWTFSSIWVSTSFRWRVSPCLLYDQILKTVRVFWKLLFKKFTFEKHKRGKQSFCSWFWVVSHIICKSYYSLNIFGITWLHCNCNQETWRVYDWIDRFISNLPILRQHFHVKRVIYR